MKLNARKIAVLSPIVFFNIIDRPLKKEEIWEGILGQKINRQGFENILQDLINNKIIEEKNGWYFLKNRKNIIAIHKQRERITKKYWQKAQWATRILKLVPFVRMVAVINNLSFNNCKKSSDIDLFIVTAPKRLWICRTFVIIALKIFGLKKTRTKIAGRICTGFYITENNLNLEKIALASDPYLLYWYLEMKPLYGYKVFEKYVKANKWAYNQFPPKGPLRGNFNFQPSDSEKQPKIQKMKEWIFSGWFGDWLNFQLGKYHKKHTWSLPENSLPTSTTIAEDNILKLHADDRRAFYQKEFEKRMNKII